MFGFKKKDNFRRVKDDELVLRHLYILRDSHGVVVGPFDCPNDRSAIAYVHDTFEIEGVECDALSGVKLYKLFDLDSNLDIIPDKRCVAEIVKQSEDL